MEIVKTIAQIAAEPIVDYIVAPTARQVGYLISYKDNFKNLKDGVEELKRVKATISHEVEAERRNGRQVYDAVQNWLNKVDEIIEAAQKLCDDPRHKNVGCCKGPFPDFKSLHQLSRKAKKMFVKIAEVIQRKDNIGSLAFLPDLEGVGSTSATSSEKLESREKMKEDIVLALRDPNLSRVGVYGLGGVGKTTLVKEIAKQVKDEKLFDEVVMANISQAVDLERIQGEIADFLGLHFEEMTIIGRAARLQQRIKNERSILVILDDIWELFELDKLGIPLNDHKGCKLLLTSRKLDILQIMGTQKDFLIGVLNEEEAWRLFEDMVGDVVKDVNLREVAIQVAQKCAGLIVLIVSVAKAMRNKVDIDSWKDAINQLKTIDEEGMSEKIYSALEFSYNHLESDDVKALFLLCGLVSPLIDVEYLLKCCMGLGIFKHINTPKDARHKLHRLIDSLKASCLLVESNSNGEVQMHDIVREVAVSIASRDQHVYKIGMGDELKGWTSKELLQRCTHIILDWCDIPQLPERLECPNIKLFCLYNRNKSLSLPDSFFAGMKNLKVLDLTCMHLPSLPQSFHSLINLQTLCLDQCLLGDMTNIGALTNLQILSLNESSMIMLPSELGKLTHLRMLDLTNSGIVIFPPNIISKLNQLEELYLGNTSIKWDQGDSIEENKNASLTELRHLTNLTALRIQIKGAWLLPRDIMFDKLERYKIVIGDVWESSDNYEASKMLKLKLITVIHLEHGIKELIRGVEALYLDEVHGISNVLYELDGGGFPLLKHLHIQNNGKIQHIIDSMERKESRVFFPKLETLILQNLNILEKICDGSFMSNSFARLRSVKVKRCDQLMYLFSVLMVKALCQLVEIEVLECHSIKKIVFVENSSPNSGDVDESIEFCSLQSLTLGYLPAIDNFYSGLLASSTTTIQSLSSNENNFPSSFFNSKVKFSNLETLKLSSVNLENIWQDDHVSVANSFHKLAYLSVKDCSSLKYLLSCSMVGSFPNLKRLEISECEMMEEIIRIEGRNGAPTEEVGLPKLETVVISNLKRLKKVWHSQFDGLKTMEVNNCEKLANIFPSNTQGTCGSLENLKVSDCGSVEEIFKLTAKEIHIEDEEPTQVSHLKKIHLLGLPKLKQIWSKDPQGIVDFHHLQDMDVERCRNFEYLFPFSIAVKLPRLERIRVVECGMSEIVAKKVGAREEKVLFHFGRLHSLVIWHMNKLDRFYNGNHSLICPSLSELWVCNCEKLKVLGRHCTSEQRKIFYGQTQIPMQQPLFLIEEVIPKLEKWSLNNKEAIMILQDPQWKDCYLRKLKVLRISKFECKAAATFLDSIVQKAPNLKTLVVENYSLKEIFRDKRVASKEGKNEIKMQLQHLKLFRGQLPHICREGCQVDPILKVLQVLTVTKCDSLKNLVPSSASFSHLTYLKIEHSNGLINLIHPSTATSLVKLKEMKLTGCNSLEEIVTAEMNERRDEIVFLSLRTLELESLPRLNWFSSAKCFFKFPLLKKVTVRQCPRMKIFCEIESSAPMLKKVIKDGKDEEWCWEGGLNETINKIFREKVAFHNSKHLDLSIYPELKHSWYGPAENKMFCNLKSLVVKNCNFVSNVLISSNLLPTLRNLEEVDVINCDSLQVAIEFDSTKEEVVHLRKISLSNLPKLQYIWKEDCQEIGSFGDSVSIHAEIQRHKPLFSVGKVFCPNLQAVWVRDCEKLEYLFSFSIAMHAIQLEDIMIKDARSMKQIVSDKEGFMDSPVKFEFNHLISLVLWNLYELKGFSAGNHSLLCPSLSVLDVRTCAKLKLFKTQYWSRQGGSFDSKSQVSMQQPLFTLEEVIYNLEKLTLNSENLNMILQGQFSVENFSKLKYLSLTNFKDDHTAFPYWFIQNIISLEDIFVEWCSFKHIFLEEIPTNETSKLEIRTRIKNLTLNHLYELQHVCKEGSPVDPVLEILESLLVMHCSNLKHLVPSSINFNDLTYLEVKYCHGLLHLITSSTARSLVKLTTMKIRDCHSLEQVVAKEREGSEDEIVFSSLEILELECLPMIKMFCSSNCVLSLPFLVKFGVKQCPRMNIFSVMDTITPLLQEILSKEENEKMYWEEDLNSTIRKMFMDMVAFRSFKYLVLSQYPELRELWYNPVQPKSYGNLKSLVVHKCDFLSDVLLPLNLVQALSHLEELKVSECDSLKAVFDLTNMDQKEMFVKESIQLKEITLFALPKLIHIWKQNFQEIANFREITEGHPQHCRPPCSIEQVHLPNLEKITIEGMPEFKTIWHPFFTSSCLDKLKMMQVSNCGKLETIFPSYMQRAFTTLETLMVSDCNSVQVIFEFNFEMGSAEETTHLQQLTLLRLLKLKQIWNIDPQVNLGFHYLQSVRVEHCESLEYLFPFSIATHVIQLERITIKYAGSMKHIVSYKEGPMDSLVKFAFNHLISWVLWHLYELEGFYAGNHSVLCPLLTYFKIRQCGKLKLFNAQNISGQERVAYSNKLQVSMWRPPFTLEEVSFSSLESLELSSINLKNWDYDHLSIANCFHTLVDLTIEDCRGLKYLFSYSAIGSLLKLERLEVSRCEMMEEIIAPKGANDIASEEVRLSKLETLVIKDMKSIKNVWHFQFGSLKTLEVSSCGKLANIFPSDMQGTFGSLETLKVTDCGLMEEIFELTTAKEIQVSQLKELHLLSLPKLKEIWSRDAHQANLHFHNLQLVCVEHCVNLEYIFPLSIAMHATKIQDITVRNAESMNHIVSDKERILDGPFRFEFNHLTSLALWKLYELEGFFAGNHSVLCPLLKKLDVRQCMRFKLFMTQNTSGQERLSDSKLQISTQQSLFTLEEVICNLERLALNSEDASMILHAQFLGEHFSKLKFLCLTNFKDDQATFPYWFLQNITTLKELHVECSSFKEIFQEEMPVDNKEKFKTRIEKLTLNQLLDLQNICKQGFQTDPVLEFLKYLVVDQCPKLKHLLPSSVTCCNLIYLEVQNCNGLIHLITSSTAKSLVNLRRMIIRNCYSLEQVVAKDREESKDAIAFRNLFILELACLPALKMFCSSSYCLSELPCLWRVVISNCPRMEIFSLEKTQAPFLENVLTHKEDQKEHWQGDLNTTVNKIFQDMANQIVEPTKQELPDLPSSSSDDRQQKEDVSSTDPQDKATMYSSPSQSPELSTSKSTEKSCDSSIETQNVYTIKKPSSATAQNVPNSTMIPKAGLAKGSQEMGDNIERQMVEAAKIALGPTGVHNAAVGTQEIHETMDKTLTQTDQDVEKLATTQDTEESPNSYIESQKMCESTKKPSSPTAPSVPNSTMILDAVAIDSSASKIPEPMTSPILESSAYKDYKWLIDNAKQNLPYLEAGLKRHPQVIDWFNTKRRRAFAALFSEVTCILRTTRKRDLTEDDRNYIRECCAALEGAGFDASWLSYVHGCIESCANGDGVKRKLKETEAKASNLRNELASIEESLVSLREEDSRLDTFIES